MPRLPPSPEVAEHATKVQVLAALHGMAADVLHGVHGQAQLWAAQVEARLADGQLVVVRCCRCEDCEGAVRVWVGEDELEWLPPG